VIYASKGSSELAQRRNGEIGFALLIAHVSEQYQYLNWDMNNILYFAQKSLIFLNHIHHMDDLKKERWIQMGHTFLTEIAHYCSLETLPYIIGVLDLKEIELTIGSFVVGRGNK
ncbi:hypothetical protein ACJX0J_010054, partial [Zea mays]